MTYKVEEAINLIGKEKVIRTIYEEGLDQIALHKLLKLSTSNSRLNNAVYKRIYKYLGISGTPYPTVSNKLSRKFMCQYDIYKDRYWESDFLVEELANRLDNPIINTTDGITRYVISFPNHPHAHIKSKQVKAHIIAWELYNRSYVPDKHWVVPIDGDYTNLVVTNLSLVNSTEYKSELFKGDNNPAFKHGNSSKARLGGWDLISKHKRISDGCCKLCSSNKDLVVHHIINYHLFDSAALANQLINLITLCRSCHTKLHSNNSNIKDLIEVTQYSKLLELLETLKSRVPESLAETLRDVEKQLGLTDNQQPST